MFVGYGFGYGYDGGYPDDDDDGGDDTSKPKLEVELESSCEGNVVTVSGLENDDEASVTVFQLNAAPIFSGDTDGGETESFSGCGMDVKIFASADGYKSASDIDALISCAQCEEPECTTDDDCPDAEMCSNEECVPVPCECGVVKNHQCEEYECCADSDCGEGEVCEGNACKGGEPEGGCADDSDCETTEFCNKPGGQNIGNCEPVTGDCGYALNHVWMDYKCNESACAACPEGYVCEAGECVEEELEGPDTGIVGSESEFTATRGGEPCVNCDIEVTTPTGDVLSGKTDESGKFSLPLNLEGTYKVALKDGPELTLDAVPKAPVEEPEKPPVTDENPFQWLFLLILLLILIGGIIYWRKRGQKR
jgi:hypothetical protein